MGSIGIVRHGWQAGKDDRGQRLIFAIRERLTAFYLATVVRREAPGVGGSLHFVAGRTQSGSMTCSRQFG
jgi:hypothetical protein